MLCQAAPGVGWLGGVGGAAMDTQLGEGPGVPLAQKANGDSGYYQLEKHLVLAVHLPARKSGMRCSMGCTDDFVQSFLLPPCCFSETCEGVLEDIKITDIKMGWREHGL